MATLDEVMQQLTDMRSVYGGAVEIGVAFHDGTGRDIGIPAHAVAIVDDQAYRGACRASGRTVIYLLGDVRDCRVLTEHPDADLPFPQTHGGA